MSATPTAMRAPSWRSSSRSSFKRLDLVRRRRRNAAAAATARTSDYYYDYDYDYDYDYSLVES